MAYANGFTLWNYQTTDTLSAVKTEGYFDEVAPFARKGDMIIAVASAEGIIEPAILFVGTASSDAVSVVEVAAPAASA